MKLPGAPHQLIRHPLYRADGIVTTGGTAQLVLAQSLARSLLILGNGSTDVLMFEFGAGAATAVMSGANAPGANLTVSSVTVNNAGFNFTNPPVVEDFLAAGGRAIPVTPAPGSRMLRLRLRTQEMRTPGRQRRTRF